MTLTFAEAGLMKFLSWSLAFLSTIFSIPQATMADDSPQWGRTGQRNNAYTGDDRRIPSTWNVGRYNPRTRDWDHSDARHIRWMSQLGSQTYGTPVVAQGQIFVSTNNAAGYLERCPSSKDMGCLLCFREVDGELLWQYSSEKLPTGRVNDWPQQGIVSAPLVEKDRLWFVNNRGEVVCADTKGFHDEEDDGPVTGVRVRLFTTIQKLTPDTNWSGSLPARQTLRQIAEMGGVQLPSYFRVVKQSDRTHVLQTAGRNSRAVARLEYHQNRFLLESVSEADDDSLPTAVHVQSDVLEGFTEGRMSRLLQHLFAQHGIEIPDNYSVSPVVPGRRWEFHYMRDGRRHQYTLNANGTTITAEQLIDTTDKREADVVWSFDMMEELGVRQHNLSSCSVTTYGDALFVCTSNGVDETHMNIPAPDAPAFIALDKRTGEILWTDSSPNRGIMHGQWASPAVGIIKGVPQVVFCGGDGWVYGFHAENHRDGQPELLWKFDANPKDSRFILGGRGTRNNIVAAPVIVDDRVYVTVGQDPEHGEGDGHLWCIDATARGDISAELVVDQDHRPLPPFRHHAACEWGLLFRVVSAKWNNLPTVAPELREQFAEHGYPLERTSLTSTEDGVVSLDAWVLLDGPNNPPARRRFELRMERDGGMGVYLQTHASIIDNPHSAVIWHYHRSDRNGDGKFDSDETFHRSLSSVVVSNGILVVTDLSGYLHCLDAHTGKVHWVHDLLASCWSTPLVCGDRIYVPDEDGDIAVFALSSRFSDSRRLRGNDDQRDDEDVLTTWMDSSVYSTPVAANGVLYITSRNLLFAVQSDIPPDK